MGMPDSTVDHISDDADEVDEDGFLKDIDVEAADDVAPEKLNRALIHMWGRQTMYMIFT